VRANLSVIANERAAGAYNIGTGIETSVNVLARHIARYAKFEQKPRHAEGKSGEQRRSVLAVDRARAELDWAPTTDLGSGLEATVAWFARRN
jgi:UDP-glucose 4-epimerase